MNRVLFILTLILITSYLPAQKRHNGDSVSVTIKLNNVANNKAGIDSVYIIFDRYDLSGPGTIRQVYHPVNNRIHIENIPKGKYYIELFCLGQYQQHFSRIRMIHPRASSLLKFYLKEQKLYQIGTAYIPIQKVDFSRLSITR